MTKYLKLLISFCALLFVASCSEDDDIRVFTGDAVDITETSARIICDLDADKKIINHECGVVYSEFRDEVQNGQGRLAYGKLSSASHFSLTIDLVDEFGPPFPHTYIYYCGYVVYDGVTYWGEVRHFETPERVPVHLPEEE